MMNGKALPKDPVAYWPIMSSIPQTLLYEGYGIRKGMWTVKLAARHARRVVNSGCRGAGSFTGRFTQQKASCVPPGCNGLMTVLDWLTNPWEPYKRGIMIGFDSSMDYAWIYRSILESVALTLKNNYDNMCNEMNHFAKHVIITGGGSNSDLFMQILPTCSTFRHDVTPLTVVQVWGQRLIQR